MSWLVDNMSFLVGWLVGWLDGNIMSLLVHEKFSLTEPPWKVLGRTGLR